MRKALINADWRITAWVQGWPSWLYPLMWCMTLLASPVVIVGLALVVAAVYAYQNEPSVAWALLASVAAIGANAALKLVIKRARPATEYAQSMLIHTYSFPSGHTFAAVVVYGLFANLAYTGLQDPWAIFAAVGLSLLIPLVGLSRIYLGAHYALDVLGGWMFGAVALVCIIKVFGV